MQQPLEIPDMIPAWVDGELVPVEKLHAHQLGLRHKAVSVFLCAGDDILIQQRAAHKYHTPLLWANTCCTHPMWGESMNDCAHRRLHEELGIEDVALTAVGQIEYRADVGQGLIEHELVEVFIGQVSRNLEIDPNPDEVVAVAWSNRHKLAADARSNWALYTPWFRIYLDQHQDQIFKVN